MCLNNSGKKLSILLTVLVFLTFSIYTACEIGLGEMVNTEKPVISMPSDSLSPGAFIQGNSNCIELQVDQPFGIDRVYMNVWYIDPKTGMETTEPMQIEAHRFPPKLPWECEHSEHIEGRWYVNLDTTKPEPDGMGEGRVRAQVTAVDSSGNKTTTTDMIYTVKNMPPEIELAIPTVKGRDFDSIDFDLNDYLVTNDPIFVGFDIMGIATDNMGIEQGYPMIMIWPLTEDDGKGNPNSGKWAHWRSTQISGDRQGMTTKRFVWPMKELVFDEDSAGSYRLPLLNDTHRPLHPGIYRFRIKTMDTAGKENYYPNRTNNERGPGGQWEDPNTTVDFMEINYINQELPIVTFMSVPPYFNGVGYISENNHYIEGDYTVYVTLTSTMDVLAGNVKGWITDSADASPNFSSPEYNFIHDPIEHNENRWKLTISNEDTDKWYEQPVNPLKAEEVTLFVNTRATNVNGESSPPMSPRNFNFDKKPPTVVFDRPVVVPTAFAKGSVKGGNYEIFYPLQDPLNPMPRWVTGLITAGGTNLDGFVLSRIYYHIGYLGDDSPVGGVTREEIYNEADWKDTELHRSGIASDEYGGSWSGSLYAWNYQNNFNEWGKHKECETPCDYELCGKLKGLIQEGENLVNVSGVNYTTEGKRRFYLPFYVKVVDAAGNFHITHYKLCIDPDLDIPYVSISTPAPDSTGNTVIGGEVSLSGLATDNDWIHSVQIRIKKYGEADQLNNENLIGDANGAPFTDPNPPAGSVGTFKYYRPYEHNKTNEKDNLIHWVYYNFNQDGTIGTSKVFPVPQGDPDNLESKAGWFNAEKRNNDMVIGWFFNINTWGGLDPEGDLKMVPVRIEVRAVDSKEKGPLSERSVVGASTIMDVQFSSGVPTINNPVIKKTGTLDRDYFEGITASGRFGIQMDVSDDEGLMHIRVSINGKRFDLLANYQNLSSNASNQSAGLSITTPHKPTGGRDASTLNIDVNTLIGSDLYSDLGYGKTGVITIEVEVHDNSTPTFITRTRYLIGVDNYYPTTSIETSTNASGNQFELSGLASDTGQDSGSLQDLARVLVYFEELTVSAAGTYDRTGIYHNPRGFQNGTVADGGFAAHTGTVDPFYSNAIYGNPANIAASGNWNSSAIKMESYPNVRPHGSTSVTWGVEFKNFPVLRQIDRGDAVGRVWESPHAMVIDSHELSEDLDNDGTFGEAWSGMVEKTWRAWMDTSKFRDGPWKVHYIVMDQAGNATHSTKDIFIENNKPLINYINLGTNIRGTTASNAWTSIGSPGDFMSVRYSVEGTAAGNRIITFTDTLDNPFRIRGNRLAMRIETSKGNSNKYYTVSYVTPLPTIHASEMERGKVYTIAAAGTTDWEKYGAVNNSNNTTFVASGPGEGTGTVVPYTIVRTSPAQQLDQITTEEIGGTTVTYQSRTNDIVFSDFTSILDSQKVTATGPTQGDVLRPMTSRPANWPTGWDLNWPERLFIIKVYDTTIPGRGEQFQLAHAVLVALDIDNSDAKAPVINPAAFGRKFALPATGGNIDNEASRVDTAVANYNENIIMSGNARQGYVQYAGHSGGTAQISGQVIFTGKASDNQRINNITVTIPGYSGSTEAAGTAFTVATWTTGTTNALVSSRETMGTAANQRWYFKIIDQSISLDYGHTINWEFGWDSSYVENQVGNPDVVFTVNDFRASGAAVTKDLAVNIVPYVSEITTGLSGMYGAAPSAFARSSAGWYPVRESETVTIKGFNLGTDGSTITSSVNIGGTVSGTNAPTGGTNITPAAISGNRNAIQFNVGTTAMSGDLTVRVNSSANSINNRTQVLNSGVADNNANRRNTANRVAYNWEPNSVNNNMLTNDRKIYIWSAGNISNLASLEYPHLSVSPTGTRLLAYNRGTGLLYRNTNDSEAQLESSTNRYLNVTTTFGNNGLWYVGTSNQTAQNNNSYAIHARQSSSGAANADGSNKIRILNLGATTATLLPNRVRLPKIHAYDTSATSSRVVTSYFDELENRINFHYGTMTGTQAANTSATTTNVVTRGGDFANHHPTPQIVTQSSNTHDGSMYTAVATLSNGTPVIAWYSPKSDSIVFSHGISSAYTYTYSIENHGLTAGTANANRVLVRDGGNDDLGTIYFVRNVNGNVITFNILSTVITGQNLNAATVIKPIVGNNTAASSQNVNGVTAYAYRMPTGHGLTTGNEVVIFNSNNSMYYGPYVVREVGTAVGNALNVRFAIDSTTIEANDFFNVNINAQNLCIYMINPTTNTLTLPNNPTVTESTTATVTTTTAQWQNNIVSIDTGKGSYVDMAVDGGDNIHLAYYDSNNGGLHYAYIPYNSATGFPNKTSIEKAKVDTFLGAGTNIMINIRQEAGVTGGASGYRPYISYIHSSYATTKGAVRIAWPITAVTGTKYAVSDNTDSGDLFLGTWEVMTVPIANPPITPLYSTFVVTNGVPTSVTNWVKPTGINWPANNTANTIEKSVVIGFMAGTRYEGAVLKTSIPDLKY